MPACGWVPIPGVIFLYNAMKADVIIKAHSSTLMNRIALACIRVLPVFAVLSPITARAQWTWSTTNGNWSTDLNWNPVAVPLSDPATQLVFEATGGLSYTTINDIGGGTFILNKMTVNNTGTGTVTITGLDVPTNTFTLAGSNPTLDITGNVIFNGLLVGNNSSTIRKTGPGTFIHDSNNTGFTGTVIIDQGTFLNRSTTNAVTNFNPVSIVVNNGGTYQFGLNGTGDPNLPNSTYITVNTGGTMISQEGEVFGGIHLQGGTVNLQAGVTASGSTAQSWTSGVLTGTNFTIAGNAAINKTTPGTVFITGGVSVATGTGNFNIRDGIVSMANAANLGTANISLGDASGTAGTFDYQGATASRPGNFTIASGDGVITVGAATTILTLTGSMSGPGDLSKAGPGKLRIAGSLGASGTTTVNEGTLQVEPVTALGNFAVAAGAVLAVNSGVGQFSLAVPSINFLNSTSVLQFDLNTSTPTTAPLVVVGNADGIVLNGNTPTLRVTNLLSPANGTYTLVDYNGTPITSGFNLALPGRTTGSLIYDAANTKIDMTVTGTDTVKWTGGVNGDWDLGTAAGVGGTNNWKLVAAGTPTNFIDTDNLTFDDTASRFDINLTSVVQPATTVVNSSSNYTVTGVGKLSGPTSLSKSGTGTLIFGTNNDYSGGTLVSGGALQLGNGGANGSIVGPVTLNGGMLSFKRSDDISFTNTLTINGNTGFLNNGTGLVTFPAALNTGTNTVVFGGPGNLLFGAPLTGAGTYNKEGTGTLTLVANNNPFTGTLNINGGVVALEDFGAGGDLGATSIVINGGTFILGANGNTDLPDTTMFTINAGGLYRLEQGENYGGFILNGGEFRMVSSTRTGVNSTAIAAAAGNVVYDLRSGTITADITSPGAGGALNQGTTGVLSKTTSGTVTISGGVSFQNALELRLREGTISMGIGNVPAGGSAMISLGDATTSATFEVSGAGSTNTIRPFTLNAGGGSFRLIDPAGYLAINGIIVGPGALTKSGNGTLVLNSPNDYTGGTLVSAGTLEVNNVAGSGTGPGMVAVAGTLSGSGSIVTGPGNSVLINGVFQPGFSGVLFGVDFNLTAGAGAATSFSATSVARFDLWSTTGTDQSGIFEAADRLAVGGDFTIAAGAVLKLSNPNLLAFQAGDVFRLFDWTSAGTLTGSWTIDSTDLNLNGVFLDTANLYTAGTIAITAIPEPGSVTFVLLGLAACISRGRRRGASIEQS